MSSVSSNYDGQNDLTKFYGKFMSKTVRIAEAIGTFGLSELDSDAGKKEKVNEERLEYFARYTPVNYLVNGDTMKDNKSVKIVENATRTVAKYSPMGLIFGDSFADKAGKCCKTAYKYSVSNMVASLFTS